MASKDRNHQGSFMAVFDGLMYDEKPVKFVSKPLESQICLFCKGVLQDPVLAIKCGHTFCRKCCEAKLAKHESGKCPVDEIAFGQETLVVNLALANQVKGLLIHCRYGLFKNESENDWLVDKRGCPEVITLGGREEHERTCTYNVFSCPNNAERCGKFRPSDLESHLEVCAYTPCPNSTDGCKFFGTPTAVKRHHTMCINIGSMSDEGKIREALASLLSSQRELLAEFEAFRKASTQSYQQLMAEYEESRQQSSQQFQELHSKMEDMELELQRLKERSDSKSGGAIREVTRPYKSRRADSTIGGGPVMVMESPALPRDITEHGITLVRRSSSSSSTAQAKERRASQGVAVERRNDGVCLSWELEMPFRFKCIGTFKGHTNTVWKLTSHSRTLFSADGKGVVKVWDMGNLLKGCVHTLEAHSEAIQAMATTKDFLFTAGADESIISWDLRTLKKHTCVKNAHEDGVDCLQVVGSHLFSTSHSIIKVWEAATLQHRHTMQGLHHRVRALAYDRQRERVYSGSHNKIHIWDAVEPFGLVSVIETSFGSIYSIALTRDLIAVGTYNRNVHLYDIHTHEYREALRGHLGAVAALDRSPTGTFLVTGSHDNTCQIWDLQKRLPYQILQRHEAPVNTVLVFNDLLFTGSEDREIKVFKLFRVHDI